MVFARTKCAGTRPSRDERGLVGQKPRREAGFQGKPRARPTFEQCLFRSSPDTSSRKIIARYAAGALSDGFLHRVRRFFPKLAIHPNKLILRGILGIPTAFWAQYSTGAYTRARILSPSNPERCTTVGGYAGFSWCVHVVRQAERRLRPNIQEECLKTLKTSGPRSRCIQANKKAFRARAELLQSDGPKHYDD
jgi:hypothetical protein